MLEREGHGVSKGNRWRLRPVGDDGESERNERKRTQSYREVSVFIKTPVLSRSLVTLSDEKEKELLSAHVRQ